MTALPQILDPHPAATAWAVRAGRQPFNTPAADDVTFDLEQAQPDPDTYPLNDFLKVSQTLIERDGPTVFDYFDPKEGYPELALGNKRLREQIAMYMERRDGRPVDADGVVLAQGSAQAVSLAMHAYLEPGDGVVAESATFLYALRFMEAAGAEIQRVSVDRDGIHPDEVEAVFRDMKARGIRPKMIYTIANYHVPTAALLSADRREALLDLASRWGVVIVEDNVYGELRFDGEAPATMLSQCAEDNVIQVGSFSKPLCPGLRVGWMAGSPRAIAPLAAVREDLGVSQWNSRILAEYLEEGAYEPHIARVMQFYRTKRDEVTKQLQEHVSEYATFEPPRGSFFYWLRLHPGISHERVRAEARKRGIHCTPGERLMVGPTGGEYLRLAFSKAPLAELTRGVAALGEAFRAAE